MATGAATVLAGPAASAQSPEWRSITQASPEWRTFVPASPEWRTLVVDNRPPTAPTNLRRLTGTVEQPGIIAWDAATDNSAGPLTYDLRLDNFLLTRIRRHITANQVDLRAIFADFELHPSYRLPFGTFNLTVTAKDASGNVSARSNAILVVLE